MVNHHVYHMLFQLVLLKQPFNKDRLMLKIVNLNN